MGPTPAKVGRKKRLRGFIPRRDQPPDPWSSGGSILMVDPRTAGPGIS